MAILPKPRIHDPPSGPIRPEIAEPPVHHALQFIIVLYAWAGGVRETFA